MTYRCALRWCRTNPRGRLAVRGLLLLMILAISTSPPAVGADPTDIAERSTIRVAPVSAAAAPFESVVVQAMEVALTQHDLPVSSESPRWLWDVTIVDFLPRLHITVSVVDRTNSELVMGRALRSRANVTLYNDVEALIDEMTTEIMRYRRDLGARPPLPDPPERGAGATAEQATADSMTGESGPGEVAPGEMVVSSPRHPAVDLHWALQIHYSFPRMGGAGVGVQYIAPGVPLSAAVEADVYAIGWDQPNANRVLHLESRLLTGAPVFRGHAWSLPVEARVSTGFGLIRTALVEQEIDPFWDWYWNVVNAEASVATGKQTWFLRLGLSYYLGSDRGLLAEGLGNGEGNPQLFVGTRRFW